MLGAAIMLCALIGGSFSLRFFEYDCEMLKDKPCDSPRSRTFPETKDEMDTLCREGISTLKCRYEKLVCNGARDVEVRQLAHIISFLETELCNEDTDLYRTVSSNLPCIGETFPESFRCRGDALEEKKNHLSSIIENPLEDSVDIHPNQMRACMHYLFMYACGGSVFEKRCGRPVGDAMARILENSDTDYLECPQEIRDQLPHAIDALRLFQEAEEEAVSSIKRRKK